MLGYEFCYIDVIRKLGSATRQGCHHLRHFDGVGFRWHSKGFPYFAGGYFGSFSMHIRCYVKKRSSQRHLHELVQVLGQLVGV